MQSSGTKLTITAEDRAGNVSNPTTITVVAQKIETERVKGTNRLATAIEISKLGWKDGLETTEKAVILARADNPADALSAASFSGIKDAPILLTYSNTISSRVIDEMKRLNAKTVYVLGGEKAISRSVVNTLNSNGFYVERISGINRYQTAHNINRIAGTAKNSRAMEQLLQMHYQLPPILQ